jgi:hypothetical protein
MKKAAVPSILVAVVLLITVTATAQQPKKIHRIGYLSILSLSAMVDRIEAFRQPLHEFGYMEGKTLLSSGDLPRGA